MSRHTDAQGRDWRDAPYALARLRNTHRQRVFRTLSFGEYEHIATGNHYTAETYFAEVTPLWPGKTVYPRNEPTDD